MGDVKCKLELRLDCDWTDAYEDLLTIEVTYAARPVAGDFVEIVDEYEREVKRVWLTRDGQIAVQFERIVLRGDDQWDRGLFDLLREAAPTQKGEGE